MKFKELVTKVLKNKIGRVVFFVVIALLILSVVLLFTYNRKQELSTKYIIAKLEESSELTTAKLTYTGFSEFKDSGIAIINKSDFLMVYTAVARAGIDVKDVKVDTDVISKTIWVTIPKAEILEVKVDPNTIKYYDEGFALFNTNSKDDANRAQALAEENAKTELAKMGILQMADDQAEALIKGLLQDVIPKNYELKIKNQ